MHGELFHGYVKLETRKYYVTLLIILIASVLSWTWTWTSKHYFIWCFCLIPGVRNPLGKADSNVMVSCTLSNTGSSSMKPSWLETNCCSSWLKNSNMEGNINKWGTRGNTSLNIFCPLYTECKTELAICRVSMSPTSLDVSKKNSI